MALKNFYGWGLACSGDSGNCGSEYCFNRLKSLNIYKRNWMYKQLKRENSLKIIKIFERKNIIIPVANCVNKFISKIYFRDKLKIREVVPVFKKNNPKDKIRSYQLGCSQLFLKNKERCFMKKLSKRLFDSKCTIIIKSINISVISRNLKNFNLEIPLLQNLLHMVWWIFTHFCTRLPLKLMLMYWTRPKLQFITWYAQIFLSAFCSRINLFQQFFND